MFKKPEVKLNMLNRHKDTKTQMIHVEMKNIISEIKYNTLNEISDRLDSLDVTEGIISRLRT